MHHYKIIVRKHVEYIIPNN